MVGSSALAECCHRHEAVVLFLLWLYVNLYE